MPAVDLATRPSMLSRFDVVGEHSETLRGFVKHLALLNSDDCEVKGGDAVDVVHMKPPLETDDRLCVHVAGRIPLTNDEIRGINAWLEKVKDEYQTPHIRPHQQYIIDPPWEDKPDSNRKIRRYRRYSCAGFVLDAHAQVDVQLLVIDTNELPEVSSETVKTAYPEASSHPVLLAKWGLKGDGPWRIVLAGYVLHALDRSSDEIRAEPYLAQAGDELF